MKIHVNNLTPDAEKIAFVDNMIKRNSRAGKISALKLTPEQRSARAKKAVMAREKYKKMEGLK